MPVLSFISINKLARTTAAPQGIHHFRATVEQPISSSTTHERKKSNPAYPNEWNIRTPA
jgi:hypothetical protein